MQPMRPGQRISGLAGKAKKTAFHTRPTFTTTEGPAQAARARAQAALQKIQSSTLAGSPVVQAFQQYLQDRLSRGEDMDEFIEELKAKAEEEVSKRRHIVSCLASALNLFRGGDKLYRVRHEVVRPARANQLSGSQAWDRLSAILGTPYPFLSWLEGYVGPFTIGAALQAAAGAGVGIGAAEGISGLRHCPASHFRQVSVGAGTIAEVDFGAQLSVSKGKPASGVSYSAEVALGGGHGASGGVTVCFNPTPRRPTLQDQRIFDYEFTGIAVTLGGGGGLNFSVALGATHTTILGGTVS